MNSQECESTKEKKMFVKTAVRAGKVMFARIVHGRDTDIPSILETMPAVLKRMSIDPDIYFNKMTFQATNVLERKLFKKITVASELMPSLIPYALSAKTRAAFRIAVRLRTMDLANFIRILTLLVEDVAGREEEVDSENTIPADTTGLVDANPLVILCAKLRDYCIVYTNLLESLLCEVTNMTRPSFDSN